MSVSPSPAQLRKNRITMIMVFLVCALPILIALYLHLYNKPESFNNYGTLIVPQLDVSKTVFKNINGEDFTMSQVAGKWVLIQVINSDCDKVCQNTMFYQRQARKTKGQDASRIERIVFVTDNGPLETMLLRQFPEVHFIRADVKALQGWLPLTQGLVGSNGTPEVQNLHDHVFVIDPHSHVMMRFPPNGELDFAKFRKDLSRLLWASNIG